LRILGGGGARRDDLAATRRRLELRLAQAAAEAFLFDAEEWTVRGVWAHGPRAWVVECDVERPWLIGFPAFAFYAADAPAASPAAAEAALAAGAGDLVALYAYVPPAVDVDAGAAGELHLLMRRSDAPGPPPLPASVPARHLAYSAEEVACRMHVDLRELAAARRGRPPPPPPPPE
jgi:hypothetical protein